MKDKELLVYPQKKEDENFNKGLTLRDYFAAKAMHADLSTYEPSDVTTDAWCEERAIAAYQMADAMLKVRKDTSPD